MDIIRSNNWKTDYNNAITYAKKLGLDKVITFYSESYVTTKQLLNVEYGYPQNRPDYVEPEYKGPNGDFSYWRGAVHE